jgi:MFS transporter, AAHS family, 4-hydroxybenzoate transporter
MKIDVGKTIDDAKLNSFQMTIALLGFLFTIAEGVEMACLGFITTDIADDWDISPHDLTLAHMAVLVGILIGSLVAGMLSDKIGRRRSLLLMFTIATVGMGISFFIANMTQLVVLRFITGFGAGGALPIAIALVAEYAPTKYRNMLVVFAFSGASFASVVAGYLGNYFIANYGWQGMFLMGFCLALPILIWMYCWLPESVKYLVVNNKDLDKAKGLLQKASPTSDIAPSSILYINEPPQTKSSLASLFSGGMVVTTLLLWLAFIGAQVTVFLMSVWLPTFLQNAGWEADLSRQAVGHYYLGAFFGAILLGFLADKIGAAKVIIASFPLAAILYFVLGQNVNNVDTWWLIAPIAGAFAVGGIMALAPFAAHLYPTSVRGTGVGAALGIGRIGSIMAPPIGKLLLAAGIGAVGFYNVAMIAPIVASLSIWLLVILKKRKIKENE